MAACADIGFEIDENSKIHSNISSQQNTTHSENNTNDPPKDPFFQLDTNWDKEKFCHTLLRKNYRLHKPLTSALMKNTLYFQLIIQFINTFNKIYCYYHPWRVKQCSAIYARKLNIHDNKYIKGVVKTIYLMTKANCQVQLQSLTI